MVNVPTRRWRRGCRNCGCGRGPRWGDGDALALTFAQEVAPAEVEEQDEKDQFGGFASIQRTRSLDAMNPQIAMEPRRGPRPGLARRRSLAHLTPCPQRSPTGMHGQPVAPAERERAYVRPRPGSPHSCVSRSRPAAIPTTKPAILRVFYIGTNSLAPGTELTEVLE